MVQVLKYHNLYVKCERQRENEHHHVNYYCTLLHVIIRVTPSQFGPCRQNTVWPGAPSKQYPLPLCDAIKMCQTKLSLGFTEQAYCTQGELVSKYRLHRLKTWTKNELQRSYTANKLETWRLCAKAWLKIVSDTASEMPLKMVHCLFKAVEFSLSALGAAS